MPSSSSFAETAMQFIKYGFARITSTSRFGKRMAINVEFSKGAELLQKAIEEHTASVDAALDGKAMDLGAFQRVRAWLREQGDAVRIATGLREIQIRHLLPDEEPDIDVELAELSAAFEAWAKARVGMMMRVRRGEDIQLDHPDALAAHEAFKRYDFANQRVDAITYGLRVPKVYRERTSEHYRL